ncbi:MAG: PEP-CTERM sorting domain-containing protein [Verrucomicrobiota bacterium]
MSYTKLLKYALVIPSIVLVATVVQASNNGSDSAADLAYSAGWSSGTNGGTGFQAWSLSTSGTVFAGFFTGDSSTISGGTANINTSGTSFKMFGNPDGSTYANAYRSFAGGALSVGQTFSINLQVNYRNGNKGIDLFQNGFTVFNLNIGNDFYNANNFINGSGSANGTGSVDLYGSFYSASTLFALSLTQTSGSSGTWSITRSGDPALTGGQTGLVTGTYSGDPDQFHLYVGTTDNLSASDLAANSMSIIPEPSSVMLILSAIGAGSAFLGRRRRL